MNLANKKFLETSCEKVPDIFCGLIKFFEAFSNAKRWRIFTEIFLSTQLKTLLAMQLNLKNVILI